MKEEKIVIEGPDVKGVEEDFICLKADEYFPKREIKKIYHMEGWTIKEFKNREYVELEKDKVIIRISNKKVTKFLWFYDGNYDKSAFIILDEKYKKEIPKYFKIEGGFITNTKCKQCPRYWKHMVKQL